MQVQDRLHRPQPQDDDPIQPLHAVGAREQCGPVGSVHSDRPALTSPQRRRGFRPATAPPLHPHRARPRRRPPARPPRQAGQRPAGAAPGLPAGGRPRRHRPRRDRRRRCVRPLAADQPVGVPPPARAVVTSRVGPGPGAEESVRVDFRRHCWRAGTIG